MHWEAKNPCDSLYCNIHNTGTKSIIFLRVADVKNNAEGAIFSKRSTDNHIKIN